MTNSSASTSTTSSAPSPRLRQQSHDENRNATTMRAAAYIRVSDLSQVEGYSLDAQERAFREHCEKRDWTRVDIYREEGRSAHVDTIEGRPVFCRLLEDASNGLFDVVVVHTLDRWSRNQKVMLEAIDILGRAGVGLDSS